jgi:hypothetical protein
VEVGGGAVGQPDGVLCAPRALNRSKSWSVEPTGEEAQLIYPSPLLSRLMAQTGTKGGSFVPV